MVKQQKMKKRGYTLVEILMAVAILGMIAAIVVPRFNSQIKYSGTNKTKANLETLRTAVRLFYEQEGIWPNNSLSNLISGAPSGYQYLPVIPSEGVKNKNNVLNIPDYSGGWVWETTTHTLRPDLPGTDANGAPYSSY